MSISFQKGWNCSCCSSFQLSTEELFEVKLKNVNNPNSSLFISLCSGFESMMELLPCLLNIFCKHSSCFCLSNNRLISSPRYLLYLCGELQILTLEKCCFTGQNPLNIYRCHTCLGGKIFCLVQRAMLVFCRKSDLKCDFMHKNN